MTPSILPAWDASGMLPPIMPGVSDGSPARSPYSIDVCRFVERFATTPERKDILQGFLQYRSLLYEQAITEGFQWVDGSFLENIEVLEQRNPQDVDVVTFFRLPAGKSQADLIDVLDSVVVKKQYHVDGYYVELGKPMDAWNVKHISYWYSMWSHRRDSRWKGFVQIPLNKQADEIAKTLFADSKGGDNHE